MEQKEQCDFCRAARALVLGAVGAVAYFIWGRKK